MTFASWFRGLAQSASIRTSLVQLVAAVLCLTAAPAWGAIITSGPQNYSLATGFPTDNTTSLTFPKFDSSLGTLTKVMLSFSGQLMHVTVNYDNENTAVNQTAMTFIGD